MKTIFFKSSLITAILSSSGGWNIYFLIFKLLCQKILLIIEPSDSSKNAEAPKYD